MRKYSVMLLTFLFSNQVKDVLFLDSNIVIITDIIGFVAVFFIAFAFGCNMGCSFCESGRLKKRRNLEAYEIVEQILLIEEDIHGEEAGSQKG